MHSLLWSIKEVEDIKLSIAESRRWKGPGNVGLLIHVRSFLKHCLPESTVCLQPSLRFPFHCQNWISALIQEMFCLKLLHKLPQQWKNSTLNPSLLSSCLLCNIVHWKQFTTPTPSIFFKYEKTSIMPLMVISSPAVSGDLHMRFLDLS